MFRRYYPVANLSRTRQALIIEPQRPEKFFIRLHFVTLFFKYLFVPPLQRNRSMSLRPRSSSSFDFTHEYEKKNFIRLESRKSKNIVVQFGDSFQTSKVFTSKVPKIMWFVYSIAKFSFIKFCYFFSSLIKYIPLNVFTNCFG